MQISHGKPFYSKWAGNGNVINCLGSSSPLHEATKSHVGIGEDHLADVMGVLALIHVNCTLFLFVNKKLS